MSLVVQLQKMSIPKEPEQVMKLRGGSVLGKKTILKSDHFPGCQNKRLYPHIDGAPNYRKVTTTLLLLLPIHSNLALIALNFDFQFSLLALLG